MVMRSRLSIRSASVGVLLVAGVAQVASRQASPCARAAIFVELVRAASADRPIEARVSGGFAYAAWRENPSRGLSDPGLRLAAARVLQAYPADSREAALAHLSLGETDVAIRTLEQAAAATQFASALVLSDLAAAQLARGSRTGEPLDSARALQSIERALALDPLLLEAAFNKALILGSLRLDEAARHAWDAYLQRDASSAWAGEARAHAAKLSGAAPHRLTSDARRRFASLLGSADWSGARDMVFAMPQLAREHLDDVLLPAWANAQLHDRQTGHQPLLEPVRHVATLLLERQGERSWIDLTSTLLRADVTEADAVASALLDLAEVRRLIDQNRIEDAWAPLTRAQPRVAHVPPLAAAAELWRLYVEWHRGRRELVLQDGQRAQEDCRRRGFRYLGARIVLLRASTFDSLTRFTDAQTAYRGAAAMFAEIGEEEYAATAHAFLSTHLALQGEIRLAWTELRLAMASLRDIDSPRRRFVVLTHAVVLTTRFGLPYAAMALHGLLIDEVRRWGDDGALVRQLVERARLQLDIGRVAAARHDLDVAEEALERLTDPSYRALYVEDLRVEQARLVAVDHPERAAGMLGATIDRLTRTGRVFRVAELHLLRGRIWARASRASQALDDWLLGIERLEDERTQVRDPNLRLSHFAKAWELYDEAIQALVQRGETDRALGFVERAHGRVLLDSLVPGQQIPNVPIERIPALLGARTMALVYYVLPNELLVWSIDASRVQLHQVPVASATLARIVRALRQGEGLDRNTGPLAQLSHLLLDAVSDRLDRVDELVVVPDGSIATVPFAVLPMPRTREHLVQHLRITFSPSLTLLDVASRRLRATAASPTVRAAFFADPTPAPGSPLSRLPAARHEMSASASVYTNARTFTGDDVTKARLLEALSEADLVHFAGHAIANAEYPAWSRLVVSATSPMAGNGEVRAEDISGHQPVAARLVVLSACSTAVGAPAFGEGIVSLARPFLAAGVPQVVGTLWDIDDRAGLALMPRFHAWYRRGVGAAEALRHAQIDLLASDDPQARELGTWAAFVLVGGIDVTANRLAVNASSFER